MVALAYARMQIVHRRMNSDDTENDEATPADGVLAVFVNAMLGLLGAFAQRFSP
jgi:hypothetical protein